MMPPHLFGARGEAALAALVQQRPLLAFDFDGTLAPIATRPGDVHVSAAVSTHLARLARHLPVAIVTGRAVEDVRPRLGFEPQYVVGNHGAEDPLRPVAAPPALDTLRLRLDEATPRLRAAGITIEDKRYSLALHYRLARDRAAARRLVEEMLGGMPATLRIFGGKCVVNAVAADAPDKWGAVRALLARSGARSALFVGDDVNDEPVFEHAPPDWLTVRVGCSDPQTRARFRVDGPGEIAPLLQRLLVSLEAGVDRV
jgi:trehalose 6-phosphate phosphatase